MPAGEVVEGTGHHHILINKDFIPAGQVIPTDDAAQALRERTNRSSSRLASR